MSTILEIGPGRGDFLFQLAEENPDATIAAIEYKRKRFDKLIQRIKNRELTNIELYFGDARVVLAEKFDENSIDKIFILFSDPWPKRRHAKHRLFQDYFVEEMLRVLTAKGEVVIATDDPCYKIEIQELFKQYETNFSFNRLNIEWETFFAEKWRKEGKTICTFSYRKISSPDVLPTSKNSRDLSKPPIGSRL